MIWRTATTIGEHNKHVSASKGHVINKLAALPGAKNQKPCGKTENVFPEPNAVPQTLRGLKISNSVAVELNV